MTACQWKTKDKCGNEADETIYSESEERIKLSDQLVAERIIIEKLVRWRSPSFGIPFP